MKNAISRKKIFGVCFVFLFFALSIGSAFADNLKVTSSSYDPAPALPGKPIKLLVTIKNDSGEEAQDVIFELDLTGGKSRETEYPFSLGSGVSAVQELGTIKPSQSATVRYDVQADSLALNGDYTIKFTFGERNSPKKTESKTITIQSRKPSVELIQSSATEVTAGKISTVKLTIKNTGSSNAIDVLVGFTEDRTVTSTGIVVERQIIPIGSSYEYVSNLKPGEQTEVQFSITASPDATLKPYMAPVYLKYKDENYNQFTETRYIGLNVIQEPELDSVINTVTPSAYPGGISEIAFDLFNTGIGPAKFVVAKPSSGIGKFDNEKIFIGTLEADDYDSFKEKLNIDPQTAPGNYPIKIVLEYKDQYGTAKTIEKQLTLKVVSAAEAQGAASPLLIAAGIISLILQFLGLFFIARFLYRRFLKKQK